MALPPLCPCSETHPILSPTGLILSLSVRHRLPCLSIQVAEAEAQNICLRLLRCRERKLCIDRIAWTQYLSQMPVDQLISKNTTKVPLTVGLNLVKAPLRQIVRVQLCS